MARRCSTVQRQQRQRRHGHRHRQPDKGVPAHMKMPTMKMPDSPVRPFQYQFAHPRRRFFRFSISKIAGCASRISESVIKAAGSRRWPSAAAERIAGSMLCCIRVENPGAGCSTLNGVMNDEQVHHADQHQECHRALPAIYGRRKACHRAMTACAEKQQHQLRVRRASTYGCPTSVCPRRAGDQRDEELTPPPPAPSPARRQGWPFSSARPAGERRHRHRRIDTR